MQSGQPAALVPFQFGFHMNQGRTDQLANASSNIKDPDTFLGWLNGRNTSEVVWIAERSALRVLPLIFFGEGRFSSRNRAAFERIVLQGFRASLLSSVTRQYQTNANRTGAAAAATSIHAAAVAAAGTGNTATVAAAYATAYAARASAYANNNLAGRNAAVNGAVEAVTDAASAFSVADAPGWDMARRDALWIQAGEIAKVRPLWFDDVTHGNEAGSPNWVVKLIQEASLLPGFPVMALMVSGGLWLVAYRRISINPDGWWFSESLDQQLAAKPSEWWERDDQNAVVEDVARIVGWPSAAPDLVPASVMPAWQEGRLVQTKLPASTDVQDEIAVAALASAAAEIRRLADKISREGNLDQRAVSFLNETADMVPDGYPDIRPLFQLIGREGVLFDYQLVVRAEWPELLASQYSGACSQYSLALDRFRERREFERDVLDKELEHYNADQVTEFVLEAKRALGDEILQDVIDASVPDALAETLQTVPKPGSDNPLIPISPETQQRVATDQIESLANIGKQLQVDIDEAELARLLLEGNREYAEGFRDNYLQASRKVGAEDAERAARIANRTALGAAAGKSLFGRLKEEFPKRFRFLSGGDDKPET